jgi:hypothetical protein
MTTAANEVGVDSSVADVRPLSTNDAGTTTLAVGGLSQAQSVQQAVFATPHRGARP